MRTTSVTKKSFTKAKTAARKKQNNLEKSAYLFADDLYQYLKSASRFKILIIKKLLTDIRSAIFSFKEQLALDVDATPLLLIDTLEEVTACLLETIDNLNTLKK